MLIKLDFKRFRLLLLSLFILACSEANNNNGDQNHVKDLILNEIMKQCPSLTFSDPINWKIKNQGGGFYDFVCDRYPTKEYLNVHIENDDAIISGYYELITDTTLLKFRLTKCDTVVYFKINKKLNKADTIFYIGYYKYKFDKGLLNSGQKRYFLRNRDSLMFLKGNNLKKLPELPRDLSDDGDFEIEN